MDLVRLNLPPRGSWVLFHRLQISLFSFWIRKICVHITRLAFVRLLMSKRESISTCLNDAQRAFAIVYFYKYVYCCLRVPFALLLLSYGIALGT